MFSTPILHCMLGVAFLMCIPLCTSYKILSVLPFSMKSHHIMFNALFEGLVAKGHEVTVYSGVPLKTNASNYKFIPIRTSVDDFMEQFGYSFAKKYTSMKDKLVFSYVPVQHSLPATAETLNLPQIKDLINSNQKFDVILLETFYAQEALNALGHRFNAPVIALNSLQTYSYINSIMGNPNPVSHVPSFAFPFTNQLSFYQRILNTVRTLTEEYYFYTKFLPEQQALVDKHFGDDNTMPPLPDLLSNIALVLINSLPEVTYPRPYLPNMIEVGALHIKKTRSPLPKNIEKFMNEGHNGVIYFSLGSSFSGSSVPEFFNKAFVQLFSKLPQRVLWKIDSPPSRLSDNVMTVKWAPQADILAHPNCKLFISHGGLLSLLEATHFAVPLIGIPLFADQPMNMARVEGAEMGLALDFYNISEGSVQWAVNEVLNNPKYKKNIDQLSIRMRDRNSSPLDTAVHWVEYVAKHKGAPLLKSPSSNMSYFQYFLLDILFFVISIFIVFVSLLYILLRFVYKRFWASKTTLCERKPAACVRKDKVQ